MPFKLDTSRFYVFGIHVLVSAVIFCLIFYILVKLWYPGVFFTTDGGLKGLKLIALVDLVVGPTLTLILYKKGKKGLKTDMTIICVLQVAFLVYGIWVMYSHRPAALVFYIDTFYSMGIEKYKRQDGGLEKIALAAGQFPGYVAVKTPDDWDELRLIRRKTTAKGEALFAQAEYYVSLKSYQKEVFQSARDITGFLGEHPEEKARMTEWLAKKNKNIGDFFYIPVVSRFKNTVLAIDPQSGDIEGCVDIDIPPQLQLPFNTDQSVSTREQ